MKNNAKRLSVLMFLVFSIFTTISSVQAKLSSSECLLKSSEISSNASDKVTALLDADDKDIDLKSLQNY